ncbi:MAG: phenylalanine--tRNA ligase subunit beta [Deltaproteobacteria bacterium]|jgi:phenylalanyl-tRNA synthetase beta chain|nr:phenylalanine--tRNA ligase subunit beta [Deltaproteobacteria bacterium]
MKISLNWICDFIELNTDISTKELVETITLSVCEIEGYQETGTHLKNIVVAEVLDIKPHPKAEKLIIVEVNIGKSKQSVVCGAKNFKIGDKVPYVAPGITLPGNIKIEKAEVRGMESCGMLCAEDELYFSDDHSGLMLLPQDAINGCALDLVFPDQVDVIMEVDNKSITHRPDLWGHYGFARELGAIYRLPVKPLVMKSEFLKGEGKGIIDVDVNCKDLVPRFCGLSVSNVSVTDSPSFIQHRLTRVGLRPINNLVDLTNYVMLEYGQPMHAFDAEEIPGNKLTVQIAEEGTRLMTLYNKEVTLGQNDMTICDANGASVVAGVIGGLNSGVNEKTTSIFLEAANWDPVAIRKTSTRIGLRTDASQRFEKALDPEISMLAIYKAVKILRRVMPDIKISGQPVDIRGKEIKPIRIKTSFSFISKRLGKNIEEDEIRSILTHLGFTLKEEGNDIYLDVPTHRRTKDVSIPEDIVEEIGRIHGFNNITPIAPLFPIKTPAFNLEHQFRAMGRTVLIKTGFHEAYNYPLTNQSSEDRFSIVPKGIMKLLNPVADHQVQMRTSLLPHFVDTIKNNQKITLDFRVFELGRIYYKDSESQIKEPHKLITGLSKTKSSLGDAFFQLKSYTYNLMIRLQIPHIEWLPLEDKRTEFQHKHISAAIYSDSQFLGTIFSFSPEYMDRLNIKGDVCIAELDFDKMFLLEKREFTYKEPPKYPSTRFEISLLVPQRTFYETIAELIKGVDPLVSKVGFLDVYFPEEHPDKKSLSISIEFRSREKTLDTETVNELQDIVVQKLAEADYNLR